ncbi:MAG: FecR domain-containing protein, partial [Lachnospiraceae bacterium]|nr:FecR domain-containing protein [Lachnospiraceae bacterium]
MRRKINKLIWIATIAGTLMLAGCGKNGFDAKRNITVVELNGGTKVTSESAGETIAYEGMQLVSGDFVDVAYESDMTMQLDEDKHLYAGENTRFTIEATGRKGATKTVVALDEGSTLIGIENKLGSEESFEVTTPNATMSVRGTTFKVSVSFDESNVPTTNVEVIKGEVEVKASSGGIEQSYSVTDGKYITLQGNEGDVSMTGSGDSSDSGNPSATDGSAVSSASTSDDEWAEYYANPKEGYFFATGTAYPFFDYYADMLAEKEKQYDEIGAAGMVVVFDEPQDYYGEMIDKCCFVFCDAEM